MLDDRGERRFVPGLLGEVGDEQVFDRAVGQPLVALRLHERWCWRSCSAVELSLAGPRVVAGLGNDEQPACRLGGRGGVETDPLVAAGEMDEGEMSSDDGRSTRVGGSSNDS